MTDCSGSDDEAEFRKLVLQKAKLQDDRVKLYAEEHDGARRAYPFSGATGTPKSEQDAFNFSQSPNWTCTEGCLEGRKTRNHQGTVRNCVSHCSASPIEGRLLQH